MLSEDQYWHWYAEAERLEKAFRFRPPLEREREMFDLIRRMLYVVRDAVGLEPQVPRGHGDHNATGEGCGDDEKEDNGNDGFCDTR